MRPMTRSIRSPEGMSFPGGQAPQRFAASRQQDGRADADAAQDRARHADNYDDGLVHNHNWATGTGGR